MLGYGHIFLLTQVGQTFVMRKQLNFFVTEQKEAWIIVLLIYLLLEIVENAK